MNRFLLLPILAAAMLHAADPGMKLYGKHCVECHGDDGKDISISPNPIGGRSDILSKLKGYKSGTYGGAQKETMQTNVAPLSEDELSLIADYVARLH